MSCSDACTLVLPRSVCARRPFAASRAASPSASASASDAPSSRAVAAGVRRERALARLGEEVAHRHPQVAEKGAQRALAHVALRDAGPPRVERGQHVLAEEGGE